MGGPSTSKSRSADIRISREEIVSLVVELAAHKDWLPVLQAVVHEDSAINDTLKDTSLSLFERNQIGNLFSRYRNFRKAAEAAMKD